MKIRFHKRISNFFNLNRVNIPFHILDENIDDKFDLIKTHKNNTSIIFFTKKLFYRKFSKSKKGIEKIEAEYKGLNWYCNITKRKKNFIIKKYVKNKKFAYIDLKKIEGIKIKSWNTLSKNYLYLKKILNHYNKYEFKNSNRIHGDLTFDNIIFNKRNIFIIDWEFFNSKITFRGYDIVYLILSAACLPYVIGKKFSNKDEMLFKQLWRILIKMNLNKKMLGNPFVFFKETIKKDKILYSSVKLSKSKFFPFIVNKSHKKKILQLINSVINK